MRRSVFYASLPALALVVLVLLGPDSATGQFLPPSGGGSSSSSDAGTPLTSDQVLAIVADAGVPMSSAAVLAVVNDAGTLAAFNWDVPGNTFIAANRTLDGGAGTYSFISLNDSCIKGGPGSAAEICFTGNATSVNAGSLLLPTTNILQPACTTGSTCRWYSDAWGPGFIPRAGAPLCAAGQAGGMISNSSDSNNLYFCNGSAAQRLAVRSSWSSSLDFTAFASNTCQTLTFTATGAVLDEPVAKGGCGSVMNGDGYLSCDVSITATNTASVRVCCGNTLGCADLSAITFTAAALR